MTTWLMLLIVALVAGAIGLTVLIVMIRPRRQEPRGFPIDPTHRE